MARATLDDIKTQTRRLVKWRDVAPGLNLSFSGLAAFQYGPALFTLEARRGDGAWETRSAATRCPYGAPGDQMWGREAWRTIADADNLPPRELQPAHRIWFEADTPHQPGAGRLRPGMFMPRWASRITLELTQVRVERLQAINEADALAEGIVRQPDGGYGLADTTHYHATDPRQSYFSLWEAINGAGSVAANPWVWALTFRRLP
jgi:hypothetical protein